MKKWVLALIGLGVFALTFAIFLKISSGTSLSPGSSLSGCNYLVNNGADKTTILFFGDERTTKKYSNYIFSVEPFASNKESLNLAYIADFKPSCTRYRNIAIMCYSKELIQKASSCPSVDIIAVPAEDAREIRSSAYMGVMSINTNHPLSVFAHELGHALGNFAEEYRSDNLPAGQPNCKDSASKFTSETDGAFKECSRQDYYRSIESGFMRSLDAKRYGQYDEHLLSEALQKHQSSKITGNVVNDQDCSSESYYLATATYADSKLNVKDVSLEQGCPSSPNAGSFSYSSSYSEGQLFEPILFTDGLDTDAGHIDGETFVDSDLPVYYKIALTEGQVSFYDAEKDDIGSISLPAGDILCEI